MYIKKKIYVKALFYSLVHCMRPDNILTLVLMGEWGGKSIQLFKELFSQPKLGIFWEV